MTLTPNRLQSRGFGKQPAPVRLRDTEREPQVGTGRGRIERVAGVTKAVAKENAIECEEYRAIVRQMDCMHCGVSGWTQFCHGDQGKGMGLKTDDRTGWPGCGPRDHKPGCHYLLGSTGTFPKEVRRELEAEYARRTRADILGRGLWPKKLPLWEES